MQKELESGDVSGEVLELEAVVTSSLAVARVAAMYAY